MNSTGWKARVWGPFRLIGLGLLVAGIFALAIATREKAATTPHAVTRGGASDTVWKKPASTENLPHGNTTTTIVEHEPLRLAGRFSGASETLLIEQLTRAGYTYLASYRRNADGSASITGMPTQRASQPLVTIRLDQEGRATVD